MGSTDPAGTAPLPSPIYAAVLRFAWRRPVLRKLLLGCFGTLAKLYHLLGEFREALIFPSRVAFGYLRLLERERQALPQDGPGLGVSQGGEQATQRADETFHG